MHKTKYSGFIAGGLFAAGIMTASAMQIGDVLDFAAGGGLQQVEVVMQSGEDTFLGRLGGYSLLNVSIIAQDGGWLMCVDDWERNTKYYVRLDGSGKSVAVLDKGTGVRCVGCESARSGSVRNRGPNALSKETAAEQQEPAHVYGDGTFKTNTEGWNLDPDVSTVDILFVFEKNAIDWLKKNQGSTDWLSGSSITPNPEFVDGDGNPAGYPIAVPKRPEEVAKLLIANMNLALVNSGIHEVRVNCAGVMKLSAKCGKQIKPKAQNADEIAAGKTPAYLDSLVDQISGKCADCNSSYAVSIRKKREQLGADLVAVLFRPPKADGAGEGGLSAGLSNDFASHDEKFAHDFIWAETALLSRAWGCVGMDVYAALRDCTFTHEVGHSFGCGHWDKLSEGAGPLLFKYSSGLQFYEVNGGVTNGYHTIMGYEFNTYKVDGQEVTDDYPNEIMLFSSPYLVNPWTGSVIGDAELHDNVRTIRETASLVANYRVAKARRNPRKGYGHKRGEELKLDYREYKGFRLSGAPSGMVWDSDSGFLSGTPKAAGTFMLKFTDASKKPAKMKAATRFETVVIRK